MLTKSNKVVMNIISIVTIILGLVTFALSILIMFLFTIWKKNRASVKENA